MKFEPHRCPECREKAIGTLETLPALAMLNLADNGEADWSGYTKPLWDGQLTVKDGEGKVTLQCDNGHEWQATMEEHPCKS